MKSHEIDYRIFGDDMQVVEVELARQNGRALAIGHPFATTLAALRDSLPWLKQQKVEIVPVSEILD